MSLVPAFEIGVWNVWVFVLYSLVLVFLLPAINKIDYDFLSSSVDKRH